jgi:hypothetical protein
VPVLLQYVAAMYGHWCMWHAMGLKGLEQDSGRNVMCLCVCVYIYKLLPNHQLLALRPRSLYEVMPRVGANCDIDYQGGKAPLAPAPLHALDVFGLKWLWAAWL